jgi:hypothetical protein
MLAVIFLYTAIGLLRRQVGTREHVTVGLIAAAMTTIYVLFANKVL